MATAAFDPFGKLADAQRWRERQNLREKQSETQNALRRSRKSLIDKKVNRFDQQRQAEQQKWKFQQAKQRINLLGPYAKQILENPESYQQVNQKLREVMPESASLPDGTFEEDKPYLQNIARLYDRLNPPEGGFTLKQGETQYDPQGNIIAERPPEEGSKEAGPLVQLYHPETGKYRSVRRDDPRVDKLLNQGWLTEKPEGVEGGVKEGLITKDEKRTLNGLRGSIGEVLGKYNINMDGMTEAVSNAMRSGQGGDDLLTKLMDTKENAYRILQDKAKEGDRAAARDLRLVDEWFDRIAEIVGGPEGNQGGGERPYIGTFNPGTRGQRTPQPRREQPQEKKQEEDPLGIL